MIEGDVTFLGMIDRGTTTHRFDLTDLDEVCYKKGLWKDTLTIRTRPMDLIGPIPGSKQGSLVLKVKRGSRRDLQVLLDRLDLWLT